MADPNESSNAEILSVLDEVFAADMDDEGAEIGETPNDEAPEADPVEQPTASEPAGDEEELGRTNARESDLIQSIHELGASEEQVNALREHFVPKSSFTRARQQDADQVRQIVARAEEIVRERDAALNELNALRSQPGAPQSPARQAAPLSPDDPVEQFIAKQDLDNENPQVAEFLRTLAAVVETKVESKYSPFIERQQIAEQQRTWKEGAEVLRGELIAEFGEEVDKYFPELIKATHEGGYKMTPKAIFLDRYSDEALRLLSSKKSTQKQTQADRTNRNTMEGFASTNRPAARPTRFSTVSQAQHDTPSAIADAGLRYLESVRRK